MTDIISFDSGEGSDRRKLIQALMRYLLVVKGVPVLAISVDPRVTKSYTSILPPILRSKVVGLGSFHLFLDVSQKVSELQQSLYLSPVKRQIIYNMYQSLYKPIQDSLITDLKGLGIKVILDRSPLSNYAYTACLSEDVSKPIMVQKAKEYLERNDQVAFFVQSPKRMEGLITQARFYDLASPELNLKLRSWLNTLNNSLEEKDRVTVLASSLSLEENIKNIRISLES